jgi:hypothetical protein
MDGPAEVLALAGATVELHRSRVVRGEDVLPLTRTEVDLLRYLAARAGRVVERRELLTEVWGVARAQRDPRPRRHGSCGCGARSRSTPTRPSPCSPPTASGTGSPSPTPAPPPGLVGRAREWAALERWSGPGITVIVGPGGVGKTTLVSRWRERAEAAAPGSTRFVSLAGADDREGGGRRRRRAARGAERGRDPRRVAVVCPRGPGRGRRGARRRRGAGPVAPRPGGGDDPGAPARGRGSTCSS